MTWKLSQPFTFKTLSLAACGLAICVPIPVQAQKGPLLTEAVKSELAPAYPFVFDDDKARQQLIACLDSFTEGRIDLKSCCAGAEQIIAREPDTEKKGILYSDLVNAFMTVQLRNEKLAFLYSNQALALPISPYLKIEFLCKEAGIEEMHAHGNGHPPVPFDKEKVRVALQSYLRCFDLIFLNYRNARYSDILPGGSVEGMIARARVMHENDMALLRPNIEERIKYLLSLLDLSSDDLKKLLVTTTSTPEEVKYLIENFMPSRHNTPDVR